MASAGSHWMNARRGCGERKRSAIGTSLSRRPKRRVGGRVQEGCFAKVRAKRERSTRSIIDNIDNRGGRIEARSPEKSANRYKRTEINQRPPTSWKWSNGVLKGENLPTW